MVTRSQGEQLLGRHREREVIERVVYAALAGRGGVLVVQDHGETGVVKTALLEYAVDAGRGFPVAPAVGIEGEIELP